MTYQRLSFEDDLFTARVYKRNYRNPVIWRLFKNRQRTRFGETASPDSKHEEEILGPTRPRTSSKAHPFPGPTLQSKDFSPGEEPYTVFDGDENRRDMKMRLPIITITYLPDYSEMSTNDTRDHEQHPNLHNAILPDVHQQQLAEQFLLYKRYKVRLVVTAKISKYKGLDLSWGYRERKCLSQSIEPRVRIIYTFTQT